MKITMKKRVYSDKASLIDDIKEAVAKLKLVREEKLKARNARDLIDEL